jgi:hypothetical protein
VDAFVVYDDVNYIKRGWINRNRLLSDKIDYLKLPLLGISQNKRINEIEINESDSFVSRNMSIIHEIYKKAPYYIPIENELRAWMAIKEKKLSEYLAEQIREICSFLEISTEIMLSSSIDKPDSLKGEDKIMWICNALGANEYINPIGGFELYDHSHFMERNIKLEFLKPRLTPYKQFDNEFVPSLSIIDVLAFNGIEGTKKMLSDYDLISL